MKRMRQLSLLGSLVFVMSGCSTFPATSVEANTGITQDSGGQSWHKDVPKVMADASVCFNVHANVKVTPQVCYNHSSDTGLFDHQTKTGVTGWRVGIRSTLWSSKRGGVFTQ